MEPRAQNAPAPAAAAAPTAQEQLFMLVAGFFGTQVVHAFARLNFAETVADGKTEKEIFSALNLNPDATHRFLRACVGFDLLRFDGTKFLLTEKGALLRGDVPGSLKGLAAAIPAESHWQPWGRLLDALRTGKSPVDMVFNGDIWAYFNSKPDELNCFASAMGNLSEAAAVEVVKAYDFTPFPIIIDVGGSHGVLLSYFLNAAPNSKGILFDLPQVIQGAPAELTRRGVQNRVQTVSGNFFESIPAGGDLYVMKHIIHDWDDEKSQIILSNIAKAAKPSSTLALIEMVVPDQLVPNPIPYFMDLNMLVMVNGRERTTAEYRTLLAKSGWTLTRIIPTAGIFSLVEAKKS
jgi:hypothetical protein